MVSFGFQPERTPRPRIVLTVGDIVHTVVWSNSTDWHPIYPPENMLPIGPVLLSANVSLTYSEAPDVDGTIVSYPTVEIQDWTPECFDGRLLGVYLHYDPVYYIPSVDYFGWIEFDPVEPITLSSDILLGQEKYFYCAKSCGDNITIKETTGHILPPDGLADVSFDDPMATAESDLEQSVYWDNQYPVISSDNILQDTKELPAGMIRIVGRYWHLGEISQVSMMAHEGNDDGAPWAQITITVQKPDLLGDNPHHVNDVLGNDFDLDGKIITLAGDYGIPPQLIKAQIEKESSFLPAYRWEPFYDVWMQLNWVDFRENTSLYKVTPSSDGDPGVPTNHSNAHPNYPHDLHNTIWDKFYGESKALNSAATANNYPPYANDGRPLWKQPALDGWQGAFLTNAINAAHNNIPNYIDQGRLAANDWLQNKYEAGNMKLTAQTRLAASYGFMQLLYTTAVQMHYPMDIVAGGSNGNLPENINITETNFGLAIPWLEKQLESELKTENYPNSNPQCYWQLGYERTWIIALNMYNGVTNANKDAARNRYNWPYGPEIFPLAYKYNPTMTDN